MSPGWKKEVLEKTSFYLSGIYIELFASKNVGELHFFKKCDFDQTLARQTSEAIKDVSLEELYQAVEDLCSHGMAERVYANLKSLVELHVQESVKQVWSRLPAIL